MSFPTTTTELRVVSAVCKAVDTIRVSASDLACLTMLPLALNVVSMHHGISACWHDYLRRLPGWWLFSCAAQIVFHEMSQICSCDLVLLAKSAYASKTITDLSPYFVMTYSAYSSYSSSYVESVDFMPKITSINSVYAFSYAESTLSTPCL